MPGLDITTPRVFISYSHDNPDHAGRVLQLSNSLVADGVDCHLDRYVVSPTEGWPEWMDTQIEQADFVLVVCSEAYYQKMRGPGSSSRGRGVAWEFGIITQELYQRYGRNEKFIPVLFSSADQAYIPGHLESTTYHNLEHSTGYEGLYRHLIRLPLVRKPERGQIRTLHQMEPTGIANRFRESDMTTHPIPTPGSNRLPSVHALVGREKETSELLGWLSDPERRLITLVGPGGIGKSHLALAVGNQTQEFSGGTYFVPVTSLNDPSLILAEISKALGAHQHSSQNPMHSLQEFLRQRRVLLVLDQFEHLVKASALIAELLEGTTSLKCLVTSRERLGLAMEYEYEVHSLPTPDPENLPSLDRLEEFGAVRLFLQRAKGRRHDFLVRSDAEARALAEICCRVDGIPLALELAAAQVRTLPLQAIAQRVKRDALGLLAADRHDRPAKEQTLASTIDLSYQLLEPHLQRLFAQVAVFGGGFTPDAAEAVCLGHSKPDLERDLSALVSKSLLQTKETAHGSPRFFMLHTIREYGIRRLAGLRDHADVQRAHADYYIRTLNELEASSAQANDSGVITWLDQEHDNLRVALAACCDSLEVERGLRLAGALWRFWLVRGYAVEGLDWLTRLQNTAQRLGQTDQNSPWLANCIFGQGVLTVYHSGYTAARTLFDQALKRYVALDDRGKIADVYTFLGKISRYQGDYEKARGYYQESLHMMEELGDHVGAAFCLNRLGCIARDEGDPVTATGLFEKCLAIERTLGNTEGVSYSLFNLGLAAFYQSLALPNPKPKYERSRRFLETSLQLRRQNQETRGIAASLVHLGVIATYQRDLETATDFFVDAIHRYRKLGFIGGTAFLLQGVATLLGWQGEKNTAVSLHGAAQQLFEALGSTEPVAWRAEVERALDLLRQALGEEFTTAWTIGRAMSVEQALDAATGALSALKQHAQAAQSGPNQ